MSTSTPIRRQERPERVPSEADSRGVNFNQITTGAEPLSATTLEVYSWATWYKNLPPSPPLSRSAKLARRQAERRRMEAAGNDILKWNNGAFGVRKGLRRL